MFVDFIIAFAVATLVALAFLIGGWRRPLRGVVWAVFLILLLMIWAGGIWFAPLGPPVLGVSVLSFVIVGLFLALLVAAFVPRPDRPRTRGEELRRADAERAAGQVVTTFFWILVAMLVAVIVYRYVSR